jgi:hypothetical protein
MVGEGLVGAWCGGWDLKTTYCAEGYANDADSAQMGWSFIDASVFYLLELCFIKT